MDYTTQRLNSHNNALCTAVSMCSMECKDAFQVKQLKLECIFARNQNRF